MTGSLSQRSDYPCLSTKIYLNQASLGLIGKKSVTAMQKFLEDTARHGNLYMSDTQEAAFLESTRSKVAQLIDASSENIAVVSGASEILSQVPYLLCPSQGSRIIMVDTDFPSVTRPWIAFSARCSLDLCFVSENYETNLTETILEALDSNTSAVCLSYVQFATGTRVDIARLSVECRRVNAHLIVDITQAAGAYPISVSEWGADLVVCSCYKWLGAHGGVAFAWFSNVLLDREPPCVGWFGGQDPFDMDAKNLSLSKTAAKYTQSTLSYVSVVGLNASIDELINLGISNIEAHADRLASLLKENLADGPWKILFGEHHKNLPSHIISLFSDENNVKTMFDDLISKGIICGIRNGRIRVSLSHYNNSEDVLALTKHLLGR